MRRVGAAVVWQAETNRKVYPMRLKDACGQGRAPLLLDGAIGSELGARLGDIESLHKDFWATQLIATQPAMVENLYLDYLKAGSQILTTATYQVSKDIEESPPHWSMGEYYARGSKLIENAVQRFRGASDRTPYFCALSISSYGAHLDGAMEFSGVYMDSVPEDRIVTSYEQSVEAALAVPVPDGISFILLFETIPSLAEAKLLCDKVLKPRLVDLQNHEIIMSFSCQDEARTCYGDPIEDCAQFIAHEVPFVAGLAINCTPPRFLSGLLQRIRGNHPDMLVALYPNQSTWDPYNRVFIPDPAGQALHGYIEEWLDLGVNIMGACCSSNPETIAGLKSHQEPS